MSTETAGKPFGRWRDKLWPFHQYELKKMLPLILMKFLISFNFGLLFCLKDTLVVTSKSGGAEVIPVLKGWLVLPVAMIVMLLYSKMSNLVRRQTLFYIFLGGFLGIFFVLGFCLYPHIELFSPHASADWLTDVLGTKHSHWVATYRNWVQTLIYIMAELWSSMVIMLMFWSFVNHISTVDEAKKSYTIYIAAGNLAAIFIGPVLYLLKKVFGHLDFSYTVQAITLIVTTSGLLILSLYWWINRYVLSDPKYFVPRQEDQIASSEPKKKKPSLWESFKTIAKSRNLFHIAILVIGYGLTISIVEVTWKANVKLYYANPADYQPIMGMIVSSVGIVSFLLSFFVCGNIIRWLGWHFTAQISPVILGLTGIMFFIVVIYQNSLGSFFAHFGMTPLFFIVMFGAFQNIASKVMKYSFFDPTKEMVYIPLSDDEKVKGKASIDLVGSRLGKSGSSWIQVALLDLIGTGSVLGITAYLLPIVAITVICWSYSAYRLNYYFTGKQEKDLKTAS